MLRWLVSGGQAVVNNNGLEAKDDDGNGLTEGSVNIKHTSSTKNKRGQKGGKLSCCQGLPTCTSLHKNTVGTTHNTKQKYLLTSCTPSPLDYKTVIRPKMISSFYHVTQCFECIKSVVINDTI